MGAAVAGRRLRSRRLAGLLRHQQRAKAASNRLYRNQGDGTFEDVAGELGVADVNRAGTGVSMGAVWGDYDNDGYEDLFLYKWGRPELFHNDGGKRVHARHRARRACRRGSTPTRAVWLDYDRDGRLDLFVAGYWPETSTSGTCTTRGSCRRASSTRTTAAASTCSTTSATARSRTSPAQLGIDVAPLDARRRRGRSARHRLSRSLPRQRLRRVGALRQPGRQAVRRGRHARPASARTPKSGMNASFGDVLQRRPVRRST